MGSGSHSRTQYQQLSPLVSLSLFLWLYKDSGSRNTIYASFARCIAWVLAPIHARNINSLALLSLSLSSYGFIRIPAHGTLYMPALLVALRGFWLPFTHNINSLALLSLSLFLWLYKDSGSRNTIYASFARCIAWVLAPIHARNINSLALLSLSLSSYGFIRIPAHGTLYMPALLVALRGFWLPFTHAISTA